MKQPIFQKRALAALVTTSVFCSPLTLAQLEEVVVTATKRAESLQDVPVSVSAIGSDELGQLKMRDTTEIAAQVPNMQIATPLGDSMPVISIRGISMDDFSLNQSSPVAIYVDEVYKGHPALQSVQMFDLERLEVLRGPQGTLYGKNSTGGAVNFITVKPSFYTEGFITAGFGENSRKELEGAFETSLIDDTLGMRVAGTWTEMDGWKENQYKGGDDTNAIDDWGGRLTLLWQASDSLEAILRVSGSESTPTNYGFTAQGIGPAGAGLGLYELFNRDLPGALGVTPPPGAPQESYFATGVDDFETTENRSLERTVKNTAVSLTVNWDLSDNYTLTSISSWDDGEFNSPEGDGTPNDLLSITYDSDVTQIAQDLRIASNYDGAFNYIAGVFYSEEEVKAPVNLPYYIDLDMNVDGVYDYNDCADPLLVAFGMGDAASQSGQLIESILNSEGASLAELAGLGCQLRNDYKQTRTSMAAYFDGSYDVTDAITLRLGLRYTDDETEMDDFMAGFYGSDDVLVFPTISQDTLPEDSIEDEEVTGRVGIDYTTAEGNLFYANYSRGYRNGAFNGQAFQDPSEMVPADAETVDAFEVGFKSELFDSMVRLNGAAFYYEYSDQQFLDIDSETAVQRLVNIDSSTIYGLELEATALVTDNFTARAGLGLLDTEIDDGFVKGQDVEGKSLPQAPEVNFNLALDYDIHIGDGGGFVQLHVDTMYVDDQYFDVLNTASIEQESYWVHNARVSYYSADDSWSVSVWGKNLDDEYYFTKPFDLQAGFGYNPTHIGAPRMFGIEGTYRF